MIVKLILAILTFALAGWLLLQVLPVPAAWALAAVIAGIELVGGRGSSGAGLRAVLSLDATLLAWPLAALALAYAGIADRDARIALAAAVAAAAGIAAARHGSGADSNRLLSVGAACLIPLYALAHTIALPTLDPLALAGSCLAAAVAVLVVRGALVWPRDHQQLLLIGAAACGAAAALCAIPLL